MESTETMNVRYSSGVGYLLLAVGGFALGVGLLLGGRMQVINGALFVFLGMRFLTAILCTVEDRKIVVRNLLGWAIRTHEFASLADLDIVGSKIVRYEPDGSSRTLGGIGRMNANSRDWAELAERIRAAREAVSPPSSMASAG
jgi:hypothetical protein